MSIRVGAREVAVSLVHLQKVLCYLVDSEAQHYAECSPEQKAQHVYRSVLHLRRQVVRQRAARSVS